MSGGRCAAHRPCRLTSSLSGAVIWLNTARPSGVRHSWARVSSGMISSRTNERIHASFSSNSGSVSKSHAISVCTPVLARRSRRGGRGGDPTQVPPNAR